MSTTIDERVVEMKFDNKNFEKNVSTTMSTLDRLKAALDFKHAEKALDDLGDAANRFSLDGMNRALDGVSGKFDVMGSVAFSVINRIVNEAITAGQRIEQALGTGLTGLKAGFDKYSNKNTAVGTLISQGYDIAVVNDQLSKLNWFTDETSYNFVDMVSNIGKFTAAGKGLDESVQSMMGIANWAAMSGQNATIASRAMYQLSQAMGRGVMRLEDWKSIQNANMDTSQFREKAIEAAVALGTLERQADGTYKTLTNGAKKAFTAQELFASEGLTGGMWFTSDVMMRTFKEYSSAVDELYSYAESRGITASQAIEELGDSLQNEFGLKAFRAAQEARNWGDVASSVADAVSTSWMNVFETIFGDYEEAKTVFTQMANDLYDIFAEPINEINDLLFDGLASGWKRLSKTSGVSLQQMKKQFTVYAKQYGVDLDALIEEHGTFEAALKSGWVDAEILTASFRDLEDQLTGLSEEELIAAGYTTDFLDELKALNKEFRDNPESVSEWVASLSGTSGRENLMQAIWNLRDALFLVEEIDEETTRGRGIIAVFKDAWAEVFPAPDGERIYSITERIKNFTASLIPSAETADKLRQAFSGVISIFKISKQVVSGAWDAAKDLFSSIFGGDKKVLDFAASVGKAIQELADGGEIGTFFQKTFKSIGDRLKQLGPVFTQIFSFIRDRFSDLWALLQKAGPAIVDIFTGVWDIVSKFVSDFAASFKKITGQNIEDVFKKIGDAISGVLEWVGELLSAVGADVKTAALDAVAKGFDWIKSAAETCAEVVGSAWAAITGFFAKNNPEGEVTAWGRISEFFTDLWETIKDVDILGELTSLWKSVKGVFSNVQSAIGDFFRELSVQLQSPEWEKFREQINNIFGLVGGGAALFVVFEKIRDMATLQQMLGWIADGLEKIEKAAARVLKAVANKKNAEAFKEFAAGLLLVAAAIALLAYAFSKLGDDPQKSADMIVSAFETIMFAALGMMAVLKGLGKSMSGFNGMGAGSALFGLGVALLAMAAAMYIIVKVIQIATPGQLNAAIVIFALMGALILALARVVGDMSGKAGAILASSVAFLAISVAIGNLILCFAALVLLVHFAPEEDIAEAEFIMALLGGALLVFAYMCTKLSGYAGVIAASAAAFIAIGIAIQTLVVALAALTALVHFAGPGEVLAAIAIIAGLGAGLFFLVKFLGELGDKAGIILAGAGAMAIIGFALMEIAVALGILAVVAKIGDMAAAVDALMGMVIILAGSIWAFGQIAAGAGQIIVAAAAMLVLSLALVPMAAALMVLSLVPFEKLAGAAVALTMLMAALVIMGSAAVAAAPGLYALSVVMLAISGSFLIFAAALLLVGPALMLVSLGLSMLGNVLTEGLIAKFAAAADPVGYLGAALIVLGIGSVIAGAALLVLALGLLSVTFLLAPFAAGLAALNAVADASAESLLKLVLPMMALGAALLVFSAGAIPAALALAIIGPMLALAAAAMAEFVAYAGEGVFKSLADGIKEFAGGVKENAPIIVEAFSSLVEDCAEAAEQSDWFIMGSQAVYGFVNGFNSRVEWAKGQVASGMASIAAAGAAALAIASPSKLFASYGGYSVLGYVKGFEDEVPAAERALQDTMLKIADYMDGNRDFDPVIRPVLDLSNVQAGAARIGGYFSATQAVGIAARMNNANAVNAVDDGQTASPGGATYSFVQNNYSPKALNRLEIYRQTRNQISAIEGAMRAV